MWKAGTMMLVAVLALPGCGGHVSAVDTGDVVQRGAPGYAESSELAVNHSARVRFYKAMGAAFHVAERDADGEAAEFFAGQRKGWKGFGYLAAGQGGGYTIPGYKGEAMSAALGTLPGATCRDVTRQIAMAYGDLREILKSGTRDKHVEAAKGAADRSDDWWRRNRNNCA